MREYRQFKEPCILSQVVRALEAAWWFHANVLKAGAVSAAAARLLWRRAVVRRYVRHVAQHSTACSYLRYVTEVKYVGA